MTKLLLMTKREGVKHPAAHKLDTTDVSLVQQKLLLRASSFIETMQEDKLNQIFHSR